MNWDMEILSPTSCFSGWVPGDNHRSTTMWTAAENKVFENALAIFDENTPDRWHKVAAMVPGKTVGDVIRQYRELEDDVGSIEAGLIPVPGYTTTTITTTCSSSGSTPFVLEWGGPTPAAAGFKPCSAARKSVTSRNSDHERKKGVPWSEEEHKLFLMGLKKYGKGDWRNISRNFVITRTPTQVASHAQKYFIRQLNGGKDKRRASIHDITTLNLEDNASPPENKNKSPVPSPEAQQNFPFFQWNNHNNEEEFWMGFSSQNHHHNSIIFSSSQLEANSSYCQRVPAQESIFAAGLQQMEPCFYYPNA